ncbi:matrixin family metalloprotease [Candidatus Accumulibacter phosphatis]|uniref:Matrixin family metalloprotease n=1 Tax=Candidatus Accumulibacter phosphatis TaxID=327160 RepID=A0ABX1TUX1_9PROT|nr:M10 family metallopeptidase [Candidatus Accumulibacter phosphatis]NMQ27230.1 matrixin family metalloprotease [Candidatus Accumulibacter phosphatis]
MTSPLSSMTVTPVPLSGSVAIDALAAGIKWGGAGTGATIAYSFPYANGDAVWASAYSSQDEPDTASGFGSDHQAAARQALQQWANVADLRFVETTETQSDVGDIRFAYTQTPAIAAWWGWSSYPNAFWPAAGDIWVNAARAADDWSVGSGQFSALLHEIGHALGLKHPFEGTPVLATAEDSEQYTLMSYTDHPHALFREVVDHGGGSFSWSYFPITPQTPMLYDIAAIQHLYGANTSYNAGDDVYTFTPGSPFLMTIWDAGGTDTVSVANFTDACRIDLRAGCFSDIAINSDPLPAGASGPPATYDGTDNLAIAFGVTIEKAIGGAGDDTLIGNSANNTLDGGTGNDTMLGGDGNDYYYVRDSGDIVSESNATASTGGTDLVYSYLSSYTLGANVENGRIVTSTAANLSGNSLNNFLYAGAGNNVIDGGAGSDTVSYYYGVGGTTGVIVSLATTAAQATGGSGTDTLTAIEHLRGSNHADKLTGNSGANRLEGYAGNDTLDGGSGNDTMLGGDGNDYYYVRDSGDIVSESNATASTGGTDLVYSYLSSYTLGANVENGRIVTSAAANLSGNPLNNVLYAGAGNNAIDGGAGSDTVSYYYGVSGTTGVTVSLATTAAQATGGSGTDTLTAIEHLRGSNNADKLTGNSGANRLEGYAGNDTLDGGTGNDTMLGGDGNDYYYVRDSGDIVSESNATASTGGTDTVLTYVSSYTLGANVENGRIVTSAAAKLSGNSLNNYLYAGAGNNVIDGGAGSDTVTYYYGVSGSTGVIVSLATTAAQATGGSGTDTLTSIEHLRGSNNADQLTGNSAANRLEGYAGNDTLNGGLGNDTLIGGSGSDSIRFDTLLNALSNRDTISDFDVAADSIELENAIFSSLSSTGTLAAGSFRSAAGVSAVDANDFILYDNVSGALHYDADGNGAGLAVQFASLSSGLALTSADFLVT